MKNYFSPSEFQCHCGKCTKSKQKMDEKLLRLLNNARELAGIPFIITSGFRCVEHNRNIGGHPKSYHLKGQAVDILTRNDRERYTILKALIKVGFTHIGISKTFIHVDVSHKKAI